MHVEVVNRAGRMGERIEASVDSAAVYVAPLVEKYSGLTLPEYVEVRLVTPRQFRRANVALFRRSFDELKQRHPEVPNGMVRATRMMTLPAVWMTTFMGWRGVGGQQLPDDHALVMIIPRTLKLAQSNYRGLRLILAHELTHAAQHRANPYLTTDGVAQVTSIPADQMRKRKNDLAQGSPVIEGHAVWVHRQVVKELYNSELRERSETYSGPGSWSYRLSKKVAMLNPIMAHKMDDYDTGEEFISGVHQIGGLDLVNKLWGGIESLPNKAELADPTAWAARIGV
jgi:uncharacterized protein (DUF2342 family)